MANNALIKAALIALFYINFTKTQNIRAFFTRVDCPPTKSEYIKDYGCSLTPRHDSVLMLNVHLTPREDLHNLSLSFRLGVERFGKYTDYLTMKLDLCKEMSQLQGNFLLRMIHENIRSTSNLPLECPLKKDVPYYIRNSTVDYFVFPPYTPEGNWIFYNNYSAYGKLGLVFNNFGKIVKDSRKQKRSRKVPRQN